MRSGVRFGVDVGSVRVGLARSDPDGVLATPVATVVRTSAEEPSVDDADVREIVEVVRSQDTLEVVVGLPRTLAGAEGPAAAAARKYAHVLAHALDPITVRLVDERLTTVDAHRALRASGVGGRRARTVVDQVAAVLILQSALDEERSSGNPPGDPVGGKRRKPRGRTAGAHE